MKAQSEKYKVQSNDLSVPNLFLLFPSFKKKIFTLFYFWGCTAQQWDLSSPAKDGTHTPAMEV